MKVDDLIRKTVVYVGLEAPAEFIPYGTGFICKAKLKDLGFLFVATAQHIVDSIPGHRVAFRINRNIAGCGVVSVDKSTAIPHANDTNDLVLFHVPISEEIYDYMCIVVSKTKAIEIYSKDWSPGIGDEVCVTGLYTSHYGQVRNIPIVRVGHLAAMPEEPIRTDRGYVDGYIVELHSIAGLSGSPVFGTAPPVEWLASEERPRFKAGPWHIPLGMLIGHHAVESREDEILLGFEQNAISEPSSSSIKNTGFGVVVPIERIWEIVEYQPVVQAMENVVLKHCQASRFVPDSKPAPDANG